jgi:hypothetical protein
LPDPCANVPDGPTFLSIGCRLDDLTKTLQAIGDVSANAPKLRDTLAAAMDAGDSARTACQAADTRSAKRALKAALAKTAKLRMLLGSKPSRAIPGRDALLAEVRAVKIDIKALRKALTCPSAVAGAFSSATG